MGGAASRLTIKNVGKGNALQNPPFPWFPQVKQSMTEWINHFFAPLFRLLCYCSTGLSCCVFHIKINKLTEYTCRTIRIHRLLQARSASADRLPRTSRGIGLHGRTHRSRSQGWLGFPVRDLARRKCALARPSSRPMERSGLEAGSGSESLVLRSSTLPLPCQA